MKKKYSNSSLKDEIIDVIVNYMVSKNREVVWIDVMVNMVKDYVQNHEIYFKFGPMFHDGVFIFSIVGIQENQDAFMSLVGEDLHRNGFKLEIVK